MAEIVCILGESGKGKSYSVRNLDPEKTLVIQSKRKRLPFKNDGRWKYNVPKVGGSIIKVDSMADIFSYIKAFSEKYGKKIFVLDDFQYWFAENVFTNSDVKGFDKWVDLARGFWDIMEKLQTELSDDIRIYLLTHTQEKDNGKITMKSAGAMVTNTITPEGLFTIVLLADNVSGKNVFKTQNGALDTVKSPPEMFDELEPNDLKVIDDKLCVFYGIEQ